MSKATEDNKMTVTEKILLWEFNSYWKFMCTDENNGKNKTCVQIPPPTPVTVFLITAKLLSLWPWNR